MIVIKNLNLKFNKNKIFTNVNMEIHDGEIIHIIGPNGCGKSTFFKCLLGVVSYTGQIHINDSEIAIVADYTRIPEDLRVIDIIIFLNKTHRSNVIEKYITLYNLCQLDKIKYTKISQLSAGEKRKLEIFVAIICEKKIIILDEMTNGLDHNAKGDIIQFIIEFRKYYKEVIFFYTTHQLGEVIELNERGRYLFFDTRERNFKEKKITTIKQLQEEFFKYNIS